MNDQDRAEFVENHEGLHIAQRSSGVSLTDFVRANRAVIDDAASNATYRKYGQRLSPDAQIVIPEKRKKRNRYTWRG